MAYDPNVRASDADRDKVASLLREHHAQGRLTPEEFDDRLDRAFGAKTVGELDRLLADLPSIDLYRLPDAALTRQPRQARSAALVRDRAARRSARWRAAWGTWLAISLVCFAIWVVSGANGTIWPLWVALPLGAVVAGGWITSYAFRSGVAGPSIPGVHLGQGELPRGDEDLPGRPGR
jgi:Domain of unknown function (DUF1707)